MLNPSPNDLKCLQSKIWKAIHILSIFSTREWTNAVKSISLVYNEPELGNIAVNWIHTQCHSHPKVSSFINSVKLRIEWISSLKNLTQIITIASVRQLIPVQIWKDQNVWWDCKRKQFVNQRVIKPYVRKGCQACRGGGSLPGGSKYRRNRPPSQLKNRQNNNTVNSIQEIKPTLQKNTTKDQQMTQNSSSRLQQLPSKVENNKPKPARSRVHYRRYHNVRRGVR